jgi:hypothetical protein
METNAAVSAEFECASLLNRFYRYLDDRNDDGLAALFSSGGVWLRQGKTLSGHEQIMAALQARSPTLLVRHLVTNVVVDMLDPRTAAVSAYLVVVVLRHDNGAELARPVAIGAAPTLHTVRSEFRHGPQGWRMVRMNAGEAIFQGK